MRTESPSRLLTSTPVSTALQRGGRTRFAPLWTPTRQQRYHSRTDEDTGNFKTHSLSVSKPCSLYSSSCFIQARSRFSLFTWEEAETGWGLETKPPGPKRLIYIFKSGSQIWSLILKAKALWALYVTLQVFKQNISDSFFYSQICMMSQRGALSLWRATNQNVGLKVVGEKATWFVSKWAQYQANKDHCEPWVMQSGSQRVRNISRGKNEFGMWSCRFAQIKMLTMWGAWPEFDSGDSCVHIWSTARRCVCVTLFVLPLSRWTTAGFTPAESSTPPPCSQASYQPAVPAGR